MDLPSNGKRVPHWSMIAKIRILIVLNLFCLLEAGSLWPLDSLITSRLQGSNQLPALDYTLETVALGTPWVEWGFVLDLHSRAWGSGGTVKQQEFAQLATVGLAATQGSVALLKYAFNRKRPARRYQPRLWNTRITPSFPSGHAASSAVFAVFAGHQYPNARPLIAVYLLASSYSQVYVGNHYVGDVLSGVLLGGAVGWGLISTLDEQIAVPGILSISLPFD